MRAVSQTCIKLIAKIKCPCLNAGYTKNAQRWKMHSEIETKITLKNKKKILMLKFTLWKTND